MNAIRVQQKQHHYRGGVTQFVERLICNRSVVSSNPIPLQLKTLNPHCSVPWADSRMNCKSKMSVLQLNENK